MKLFGQPFAVLLIPLLWSESLILSIKTFLRHFCCFWSGYSSPKTELWQFCYRSLVWPDRSTAVLARFPLLLREKMGESITQDGCIKRLCGEIDSGEAKDTLLYVNASNSCEAVFVISWRRNEGKGKRRRISMRIKVYPGTFIRFDARDFEYRYKDVWDVGIRGRR